MIKKIYDIKQEYRKPDGTIEFNLFTLTIVEDKRDLTYRIINVTDNTMWAEHFKTRGHAIEKIKSISSYTILRERGSNDNMKEYLITNQFELPCRLRYEAFRYPNVSWQKAINLYELAVKEVLELTGAKHIMDEDAELSWGRGYQMASNRFHELMKKAQEMNSKRGVIN